MGYYTRYDIDFCKVSNGQLVYNGTVEEFESVKKEALTHLKTINPDMFDEFESICDISCESYKWYAHDEDMLELSRLMPNYVFTLHGEGEENDDLWECHYYRGKLQFCPAEIFYPAIDLEYLTT